MKINSVWHITLSGRSLRIDSHAPNASSKDIAVFTKKMDLSAQVFEKTRIIPENICEEMPLRKFLLLTEGTGILAGPFEIRLEAVSADKKRTNILINEKLLFLGFIPESLIIIPFGGTVLLPADTRYYKTGDFNKIIEYISKIKPSEIILSGDLASEWSANIPAEFKSVVIQEAFQNKMFL